MNSDLRYLSNSSSNFAFFYSCNSKQKTLLILEVSWELLHIPALLQENEETAFISAEPRQNQNSSESNKKVMHGMRAVFESTHLYGFFCTPAHTLLIQVAIASSVSYGSPWTRPSLCSGSADEYLLMQDITLSTLTISTV